jgi:hypothetical protein
MCFALISKKKRLFLYTALTDWFYIRGRECLRRGTKWVFKSDRYSFVLKGLNRLIYQGPLHDNAILTKTEVNCCSVEQTEQRQVPVDDVKAVMNYKDFAVA